MSVTFSSGSPHSYTLIVAGYVPPLDPTICPAGTAGPPQPVTIGASVIQACSFRLAARKFYVDATDLTLMGGPCGGGLTVVSNGAPGMVFGPRCRLSAALRGLIILRTGVNCADGSEPASGSPAPSDFKNGVPDATPTYSCVQNTLAVVGVPLPGAPTSFVVSGPVALYAAVPSSNFLGTLCAGVAGGPGSLSPADAVASGTSVTLCPTAGGQGTVHTCFTGGSSVNTQPPVCSASL
jgi:hypothetical protein